MKQSRVLTLALNSWSVGFSQWYQELSGGKIAFLTDAAGRMGHPHANGNLDPSLYIKMNSRWTTDSSVRAESTELREVFMTLGLTKISYIHQMHNP